MDWYTLKSKVINFFADIRLYWFGFILFGSSSYKIKGPDMRKILDTLKPGDVLLRRYSHYLGTMLIPGHFSHSAIYVGDNRIIHMLGDGITEEDILTFLRCDDIAVLRASEEYIEPAIRMAEDFLAAGVEYDYDFVEDNKKYYCTEFVDLLFGSPVKKILHGDRIMPDDFLDSQFFTIAWRR